MAKRRKTITDGTLSFERDGAEIVLYLPDGSERRLTLDEARRFGEQLGAVGATAGVTGIRVNLHPKDLRVAGIVK